MTDAAHTTLGPACNEGPLVSVVIPSRNRRNALRRCLDGLRGQIYGQFEVIVVDDASSDGTAQFIEEYAARHPEARIHHLVNEEQRGANASRNRGIAAASGELVAFLDSDCIPDPHWLKELVNAFRTPGVAAVTGTVIDPPPRNVFELAYSGTSRTAGARYARRLVAGNMCVRRNLLTENPLDEDLMYGCDEEGLYLRLRARDYPQRYVPNAVVLHDHPMTARSYFAQARAGGGAAAWLVYKYRLWPRPDLLPFMLAYVTTPLIAIHTPLIAVPLAFFAAAVAAVVYNELFRKGKTLAQTARCLPILLAYYHVRLFAYVAAAIALRTGWHRVARCRLRRG